jgi:hypothetical protein
MVGREKRRVNPRSGYYALRGFCYTPGSVGFIRVDLLVLEHEDPTRNIFALKEFIRGTRQRRLPPLGDLFLWTINYRVFRGEGRKPML